MNVLGYRCSLCGAEYTLDQVPYICPHHGDAGNLDVVLDVPAIQRATSPAALAAVRDFSLWRYLPLLPVEDPGLAGTPLRNAGWTPLYRAGRLAADLKLKHVFLKDDGRNPTASFKDRASAVVVARARALGAQTVTTASSGNAAAALAGMAASAGLPTVIFVPRTAPQAKVAQLLMFGARVFLVNGTYDDAFDLTLQAAREFGWYCRNTGYNPFTREGKKTAAYEIAEQFTTLSGADPARGWRVPDWVFVSVGDGNIISGIHKGFQDLLALGWIERMPKLVGVQAEGSPAVHDAWASGGETITAGRAETIADSISVGLPRDGVRAVRAARETGGGYLTVSDREILHCMRALARHAAVFAEPAAATAYAGLGRAACDGLLQADDSVVVVITGNGLKDIPSALKAAGDAATPVDPSLGALKQILAAPPANP
ncbi:MAG: threonine synthase [Anaerolineales bacterium]|nr:threonine synthase [Anaerolineales bacterium]